MLHTSSYSILALLRLHSPACLCVILWRRLTDGAVTSQIFWISGEVARKCRQERCLSMLPLSGCKMSKKKKGMQQCSLLQAPFSKPLASLCCSPLWPSLHLFTNVTCTGWRLNTISRISFFANSLLSFLSPQNWLANAVNENSLLFFLSI